MTAAHLLVMLALQDEPAPTPAEPAAPPLSWRVVTPFDSTDVDALDRWWAQHESELGASAVFERVVVLGPAELAPDTLLLGFERGTLDDAARDGALASPVLTFAFESWGPVRATGGEGEMPEFDSWQALLAPELRGRIHLRSVTRESSEGLILGEVARRLDLIGEEELPRLVVASYDGGTIHASSTSLRALMNSLPPGSVSIAPVRVAALARRAGARVVFESPREGFLTLELAAAATEGTAEPLLRWLADRFETAVAPRLTAALELEPAVPLPPDAAEWLRHVVRLREAIDREAAGALRVRLARLYDGSPPRGALPDAETWLDWLDTLLLTLVVVAILIFWRRERRRGSS